MALHALHNAAVFSLIIVSLSLVVLMRNAFGRLRHICVRLFLRSTTTEPAAVRSADQLEEREKPDIDEADCSVSWPPF